MSDISPFSENICFIFYLLIKNLQWLKENWNEPSLMNLFANKFPVLWFMIVSDRVSLTLATNVSSFMFTNWINNNYKAKFWLLWLIIIIFKWRKTSMTIYLLWFITLFIWTFNITTFINKTQSWKGRTWDIRNSFCPLSIETVDSPIQFRSRPPRSPTLGRSILNLKFS